MKYKKINDDRMNRVVKTIDNKSVSELSKQIKEVSKGFVDYYFLLCLILLFKFRYYVLAISALYMIGTSAESYFTRPVFKFNIVEYENAKEQLCIIEHKTDSLNEEYQKELSKPYIKVSSKKITEIHFKKEELRVKERVIKELIYKEEETLIKKAYYILKTNNKLKDSEVDKIQNKIQYICHELLRCHEIDLLIALYKESNFKIKIQNRDTDATGIFQLMPMTLIDINTRYPKYKNLNIYQFKDMSVLEQLEVFESYIDMKRNMYIKRHGKFPRTLEKDQVYLLIFTPDVMEYSLNKTIYQRGTKAYRQNKGLDVDKNGFITRKDIKMMIDIEKERMIKW